MTYFLIKTDDGGIFWCQRQMVNGKLRYINDETDSPLKPRGNTILEQVEVEDYSELDRTKTSVYQFYLNNSRNKDNKLGFVAPDGRFYRCGYRQHSALANYLFNKDEHELIREGWIKILGTYKQTDLFLDMREYYEMTQAQFDTLSTMVFDTNFFDLVTIIS